MVLQNFADFYKTFTDFYKTFAESSFFYQIIDNSLGMNLAKGYYMNNSDGYIPNPNISN